MVDSVLSHDPKPTVASTPIPSSATMSSPDCSELQSLVHTLSKCGTKPAILSVVPPYASSYTPKSQLPAKLSIAFATLFHQKYLHLNYGELLSACEAVEISFTDEMAQTVERERLELRATPNSGLLTEQDE